MNDENQIVSQSRSLRGELAPITVSLGRGLEVKTFDDAYRWAEAISQSQACPAGFSKVDCLVVIINGLEVGMSPMAAIQSSYIVNNRVTIFGDMPLALVRASAVYESYSQKYVGKPFEDDFACIVVSKRKGEDPLTTEYSVADAKIAELWNKMSKDGTKKTPWVTAPKRMLLFRARGFNLRDNFGDVLKGCAIAELDDRYGEDGYGEPKLAQARIVEPNLPKTETVAPTPPPPPEAPPKRGPGRPRKEESPPTPPPTPPATPEPAKSGPDDDPTHVELGAAPTPRPLVDEVKRKLAEAKRTPEEFVRLLHRFALIESAQMPFEAVPDNTLKMAVDDWPTIKQTLADLVS